MRLMSNRFIYSCLFFLLLLNVTAYGQSTSEDDVKKQAQKYFEAGDFTSALPLYSQLLSFYAKDPVYNYRYGVCALEAGNDREKPIPFLEFASKNKDIDNNVFFYLGKAYHLNYRFSSALNAYNTYKIKALKPEQDKFQVDRQLDMCRNGMELLKNISDLTVMEKKELALSDYFRAYNLSAIGLKLLVKPDDFKTNFDKKKNEESVVVLNPNKSEIYFSSYGDNDKNGKDIYKVRRMSNGEWSNPIRLENSINTIYDEDYPFVSNDGTTLYFCSRGHNSMGGYDVFKSIFNPANGTWGTPENMDFAINTPDDDLLYIADDVNQVAYFSSRRSSGQGNINVYKIKVGPKPPSIALISGIFSTIDENTHPEATITVRDSQTKNIIGVYKSDPKTGSYSIPLPSSGTYIFNVESEVSAMKTETVVVPEKKDLGTLQQKISIKGDKLLVENIFEDAAINEANLMALLKAKAKLDVNYIAEAKPAVVEEPKTSNLSNQDLVNIAYQDAKDTKTEADQLRSKSDQAYAVSKSKMDGSKSKLSSADAIEKVAQGMNNPQLRTAELDKAALLKREAKTNTLQAYAIYSIAKSLEEEANAKQAEADQALNYAKELDKAIQINSKESIAQLTAQKNAIQNNAPAKSTTESAANNLNEKAEEKQQEAEAALSRSKLISTEIIDIDLKAETLGKDKSVTTDQKTIQQINLELEELAAQKAARQKQLEQNNALATQLQQEADDLKGQTEYLATAMNDLKNTPETLPAPSAQEKITLGNELAIDLGRANSTAKVEPVLQANNSDINDNAADAFITTEIGKSPVTAENFSSKMAQANKISDPVKREEQKNIVRVQMNENWEKDIAGLKMQQTNSNDKNQRAELQTRITELENLKAMNTPTPEVALATANPTNTQNNTPAVTAANTSATETTTPAVTTTNTSATETTSPAVTTTNTAATETTTAASATPNNESVNQPVAVNEKAANENNTAIESQTTSTTPATNQPSNANSTIAATPVVTQPSNTNQATAPNEALAANTAGENANKNNNQNTASNPAVAAVDTISKTSSVVAQPQVASENNLATSETKSPETAEEPVSLELVNVEKLEGDYDQQFLMVDQIVNPDEKAKAMQKLAESWSKVADEKLANTNAQLKNNNSSENIANINNAAKELEELKQKIVLAVQPYAAASPAATAAIASESKPQTSPAVTTNESSLATNAINIENDRNPVYENRFINEQAKVQARRADRYTAQAAQLKTTEDSLTKVLIGISDTAQKASAQKLLANTQREIFVKRIEALKAYSVANNVEFNENTDQIKRASENVKTTDSETTSRAEMLVAEAAYYYNEAAIKSELNKSVTDAALKEAEMKKIVELEKTAIEKQRRALTTYGAEPQLLASTAEKSVSTATASPAGSSANTTGNAINDEAVIENTANKTATNPITTTATENAQAKVEQPSPNNNANIAAASPGTVVENNAQIVAPANSTSTAVKQESTPTTTTQLATATPSNQQSTPSAKVENTNNINAAEPQAQVAPTKELIVERERAFVYPTDTMRADIKLNPIIFDSIVTSPYYNYYNNLLVIATQNMQQSSFFETRSKLLSEQSKRDSLLAEETIVQASKASDTIQMQQLIGKAAELTYNANKAKEAADSSRRASRGLAMSSNQSKGAAAKYIERLSEGDRDRLVAVMNSKVKPSEQEAQMLASNTATQNPTSTTSQPTTIAAMNTAQTAVENKSIATENTNTTRAPEVAQSKVVESPVVAQEAPKEVPAAELKVNNSDLQSTPATATASPLTPVVNERNELVQEIVFKKVNKVVYSERNPIPINAAQPSGLVFKVQIGAFRNPIPQDLFKGFDPISGETSATGITRYTAGYFKNFEAANNAKREINTIGYKDAFVVAFCNGKRISIPEATAMLREGRTCVGEQLADNKLSTPVKTEVEQVAKVSPEEPKVSNETAAAKPTTLAENAINNQNERDSISKVASPITTPVEVKPELAANTNIAPAIQETPAGPVAPSVSFEEVKGLVYTVQVGVYSKPILANQLFNIQPLYFERTPNGLYRYTSGIFDNLETATQAKANIVGIGVKDAFVTTYFNGTRIPVEQAKQLEAAQGKAVFASSANMNKMPETNSNARITGLNAAVPTVKVEKTNVSPQGNGTNKIALPVEGLKNQNNAGIVFKVQIGVFRSEVPLEIAAIFLKLSSRGIDHYQTSDSLTIYTIGNLRDINSANALKEEVIQQGLPDAFVVAFKAGNKMKIEDAIKEVNRK